MKNLYFASFCTLLFSSCMVFHSGNTSSGPLLNARDQYVDIATGVSRSSFILGIGGQYHNAMLLKARQNMFLNRPLKKGEYYSNITSDFAKKIYFFGIVYSTRVTMSADVLKANDSSGLVFSNAYWNLINPPSVSHTVEKAAAPSSQSNGNILLNGDSLYYSYDDRNYSLYTASSVDKANLILKSADLVGKNILVSTDNRFYLKNILIGEFKSGDKVSVEVLDAYNSSVTEEALVLGACDSFYLVKSKKGFYVVPGIKMKRKNN